MKLGFAIPIVGSAVSSAAGLSAFCRGLEDLGYDTLWVGDRLVTPVDMHSTYPGERAAVPAADDPLPRSGAAVDGRRDGDQPGAAERLLAFLHEWWTTTPVSWDSEFFSLPPVHADLRPVQAGGPPIWIGGASEAAMRRVGRSGTGWLGVEGCRTRSPSTCGRLRAVRRRTPAAILTR